MVDKIQPYTMFYNHRYRFEISIFIFIFLFLKSAGIGFETANEGYPNTSKKAPG